MFTSRLAKAGALVCASAVAIHLLDVNNEKRFKRQMKQYFRTAHADKLANLNRRSTKPLPSRKDLIESLKTGEELDVLVIGGGATGAGVALDSQTRGLKTALLELDDFSSGTSSKSTKLIHGGVRYLQAAIMKADLEQYRMVKEALFERANLLEIAPHLSGPLPIMLPIYKLWQVPYYWIGIKMYDIISGKRVLSNSFYISKSKALERIPMLKKESLKGAIIYYDGTMDDARMNLAIILTAIRNGAKCVNHVKAQCLLKDSRGKVCGVHVKDMLNGNEWDIKAKTVVNATGPSTDKIRKMADPDTRPICAPSKGVHVILPGYYSPSNTGLLDPNTSDGRVLFLLPWQGMTLAGTTDTPSEVTLSPTPKNSDVEFILQEVRLYLSKNAPIRRSDVKSAWSGLRPLVRDPNKKDTKSLARNHIIEVSKSGLVTVAGGKWTTYRHMAEETVDVCIKANRLRPTNGCITAGLVLEGGHDYNPLFYINLIQKYGLDADVAEHLLHTYGDRAAAVTNLNNTTIKRLHQKFPFLEAEVRYAIREYACTAVDVIARRMRLAFLDTKAAHEALPEVVRIMAEELGWSSDEQKKQLDRARQYIDEEMGHLIPAHGISKTDKQREVISLTQNLQGGLRLSDVGANVIEGYCSKRKQMSLRMASLSDNWSYIPYFLHIASSQARELCKSFSFF